MSLGFLSEKVIQFQQEIIIIGIITIGVIRVSCFLHSKYLCPLHLGGPAWKTEGVGVVVWTLGRHVIQVAHSVQKYVQWYSFSFSINSTKSWWQWMLCFMLEVLGFVRGAGYKYAHLDFFGNKPRISNDTKQKIGCECLSFACVVVSLIMAALFIMVQTRRVIFPLVHFSVNCLFLLSVRKCCPCRDLKIYTMGIFPIILCQKKLSFHLLKCFQYTESVYY